MSPSSVRFCFADPLFDESPIYDMEEVMLNSFEKNYYQRIIFGIIKSSIPDNIPDSLYVTDKGLSSVTLYVNPDGNVIYSFFTLFNDDRRVLSDSLLYGIYQILKKRKLNLSRIEFADSKEILSQKQEQIYFRITLPLIPDEIATLRKNTPKQVNIQAPQVSRALLAKNKPFPEIKWTTVDGEIIETSALKGKVAVFCFYDMQNPVCEAQTEGLKRLYKKYEKDNIVFISVTFGESDDIWKFQAVYKIPFQVVSLQQTEIMRLTRHFPTNVIVDSEGVIALSWRVSNLISWRTVTTRAVESNNTSMNARMPAPAPVRSSSSTQIFDPKNPKYMKSEVVRRMSPVIKTELKTAKKKNKK